MSTPCVALSGLTYAVGPTSILQNVDLTLKKGQTLALLGPSGCGKTTILRLIAGLAAPTRGCVAINGAVVADAASRTFVPPERRALGMVFQDYALWPHLSVGANVAFPLEMTGVARAERATRTSAALARVGLPGYEDRDPSSLSGGQQQRVAIARAIVGEPQLVLFDEPLSNLDRELRESLVGEIGQLVRTLGLSAIYVTHDHAEAFALADTVAVMDRGRILQIAGPEDLVHAPATPQVASFLNLGTVLNVNRGAGGWMLPGGAALAPAALGPHSSHAMVLVPRGAASLGHPELTPLQGVIAASRFVGECHIHTVRLHAGAASYDVTVTSPHRKNLGEAVGLTVASERLIWFPSTSGDAAGQETLENAA
jgi:iron(III) transport system ATP-binding protein